jgi:2-keto-3-deoxy-L-rhamnonate aldolase RhmA
MAKKTSKKITLTVEDIVECFQQYASSPSDVAVQMCAQYTYNLQAVFSKGKKFTQEEILEAFQAYVGAPSEFVVRLCANHAHQILELCEVE